MQSKRIAIFETSEIIFLTVIYLQLIILQNIL